MSLEQPSVPDPVIGWDIGGAHLKAALILGGCVHAAAQVRCDLWRGPPALDTSLAALPDWTRAPARHAITMTGELCDCFADRATGVAAITAWAARTLAPDTAVYAGRSGFVSASALTGEAESVVHDIASANWHATASLAGLMEPQALLVDIGSTTTDVIPIRDGKPAAVGYSDAERLATGELVYTGAVRTPLMALSPRVPFAGREQGIAAEYFATTADVYRLLGRLAPEADQQDAADARGKSMEETHMRLARMVGRDAADASAEAWRELARHFAELQLQLVLDGASQVLNETPLPLHAPVIGCGVGSFIAMEVASRLGRPYRGLADLVPKDDDTAFWVSSCAPAVAVGLLAASRLTAGGS